MAEAQFNPEVRELYNHIVAKNIESSEQPDMLPPRYTGGARYREHPLAGNNPYYPLYHPDLAMNIHSGGAVLGHPLAHRVRSRRGGSKSAGGFWGDVGNMAKGVASNKQVQDLALKTATNYLMGQGHPIARRVAHRRRGGSKSAGGFWKDFGKGMATGASKALKVITPVASVVAPEFAVPLSLASAGANQLDKHYGIGSGRAHPLAHLVHHRRRGGSKSAGGFWGDVGNMAKGVASNKAVQDFAIKHATDYLMGQGHPLARRVHHRRMGGSTCGGSKSAGARHHIVREVMAKHGLSLPQASSFVKQHGLY